MSEYVEGQENAVNRRYIQRRMCLNTIWYCLIPRMQWWKWYLENCHAYYIFIIFINILFYLSYFFIQVLFSKYLHYKSLIFSFSLTYQINPVHILFQSVSWVLCYLQLRLHYFLLKTRSIFSILQSSWCYMYYIIEPIYMFCTLLLLITLNCK